MGKPLQPGGERKEGGIDKQEKERAEYQKEIEG